MALLILVGVIGLRLLQKQAAAAAVEATAQVLAAHQVARQSVVALDLELMRDLIAWQDPAWGTSLTTLVHKQLLEERSAFGLLWLVGKAGAADVVLAADLAGAEVRYPQRYAPLAAAALAAEITLMQSSYFRRLDGRWLLASPPPDFWGETRTIHGRRLTVIVPERDEALVIRLAPLLEARLDLLCQSHQRLYCPDPHPVRVVFDSQLASLIRLKETDRFIRSGFDITLPTPTIVGLPLDEAAFQALAEGYARLLLAPVITHLIGSG